MPFERPQLGDTNWYDEINAWMTDVEDAIEDVSTSTKPNLTISVREGNSGSLVSSGTLYLSSTYKGYTFAKRNLVDGPATFQHAFGECYADIFVPGFAEQELFLFTDGELNVSIDLYPDGADWSTINYPVPVIAFPGNSGLYLTFNQSSAFSNNANSSFRFKLDSFSETTGECRLEAVVDGTSNVLFAVVVAKTAEAPAGNITVTAGADTVSANVNIDTNPWIRIWLGTDNKIHVAASTDGVSTAQEIATTVNVVPALVNIGFNIQTFAGSRKEISITNINKLI